MKKKAEDRDKTFIQWQVAKALIEGTIIPFKTTLFVHLLIYAYINSDHIALINYTEGYCSNSPLIHSRSLEMRQYFTLSHTFRPDLGGMVGIQVNPGGMVGIW